MEKLTPEQYLKRKTEAVPGKKISPEEYLVQKNTTKDTRVATEKVQTPEEYLANKQKTTTVPKSTLSKVGSFVKPIAQDIYKTASTIPVRATQAGAAIVGQTTTNPELKKKAFEYASEPVNIGFGTQVKPLDTSSTKRAAQQTVGDVLKVASLTPIGKGLTLAKQAALQGGAYGLGNAMSEGKSGVDTIKDTIVGTGLGLVGGKTLSVVGGAKTASQLAKKTDEQITKEALERANFGPIPEASNPRLSLPAPRTAAETPIQLPEKGILGAQQRIREPYTPTIETKPRSPLHEEASKFNVRDDFVNSQIKKETKVETNVPKSPQANRATQKPLNDFIKNETDFLIKTQQKVPKGYTEKLTKVWKDANKPAKVTAPSKNRSTELAQIWNEAKDVAVPKSTNVPKAESTPSEFVAKAKAKKEGVPYVTKAQEPVPVPKVEPKDYARYENALEKDPIFVKGAVSNPDIINNYAKISKEVPTDELIDMVYGVNGKKLPNELPPSAVYNMLRSDVSKLTPKQAERLLNKQPLSKAGFDLQAAKIKSGEVITNPLEYADMIETQLKEKVASVGSVTKKSIKKFLDDNQCTLS